MKRLSVISLLLVICCFAVAAQEEQEEEAQLLEFDGKTALFAVDGISAQKANTLRCAEELLFDRLLYSGIDGINDGEPLMNKAREELRKNDYAVNFFKKRMPAYLKTDASGKNVLYEQLGQAVQTSDGYSCTYLVPIKYNVLIRDLKTEGLLNAASSTL